MPACSARPEARHDGTLLLHGHGAGRERSGGRHRHAARGGADARLHARRHRRHGQGHVSRGRGGRRRRYPPCQHLSPDAPPRRRAHRQARRPPSLHALGEADPHRFRRLSGHVAGEAPSHRRGGRHLSIPYRRRDRNAQPRARHRGAMPAWRRYSDGPRRVHALSGHARGGPNLARFVAPLGGAQQGRVRRGRQAWPSPIRDRAGERLSRSQGGKRARHSWQ